MPPSRDYSHERAWHDGNGHPNEYIAHQLGIALRTVEKRRHTALAKLKTESVAELVRLLLEAQGSLGL